MFLAYHTYTIFQIYMLHVSPKIKVATDLSHLLSLTWIFYALRRKKTSDYWKIQSCPELNDLEKLFCTVVIL